MSSISRFAALVVLLASSNAFASAPTTVTNPASGIMTTSAILNGTGTPNSEATTGWFRLSTTNPVTCNDTFGTRVPATSGTDLGSGVGQVPYSITTTGLSPGTTYYFCSIVANPSGTAFGAVVSFTTPSAPIVLTTGATNVLSTSATLGGSANPVAASTTGWFRYSTTNPGSCNDTFGTVTASTSLGSGTSSVDYTRSVSSLLPGTTYYYCAIASNAFGTSFGGVLFFTTAPLAPVMTTNSASGITTSTATLNGSGNPRGDTTVGWFRYSTTNPGTCNDTFGTRMPVTGGTALGSANTTMAYTQMLSGLTLGTTYYYCAIGQNTVGTSFGTIVSFTTLGMAPDVMTVAASSIGGTSATLNGAGTPNGATTTAWFRYSTVSPGTCNDTFGTRAPASSISDANLGSGLVSVAYSRGISGLVPATTYYFCAIATNTYGTGFGAVLSFTTPALAPTVSTNTATSITGTTATLNGSAIPNGDTATGWFRYSTVSPGTCNDSFGTRAPVSGGTNLGSGNASVMFAEPISGLTQGTTYFYCAIAQNSIGGPSLGTLLSFTTPAPPTVTTNAVSSLTNTSVTLNGTGNPNRATTTGWFRYSTTNPGTCDDTFGSRAPVSGGSGLGAGSSGVAYSQGVTGLSAGTTYYYCAIAQNAEGMAFGAVLSFTTLASPSVVTNAATLVASTSATLNGAANPNGASASGWFRYSTTNPGACNDAFGTLTASTALGAGTASVAYTRAIGGLTPATTYYFCAIANNTYGTGFGAVMSFTTPAALPSVTTNSATMLTGMSATLNGNGNPGGDTTTAWFRYSTVSPGTCNDSFGTRAPTSGGSNLGSGTTSVAFSQAISGLSPGTTYFYCAIASNSVGTGLGTLVTFTTPSPPTMVTNGVTSLTNTSVTLNGSGDPNGSATTGWFRYSSTDPGTCNDTFGSRAPVSGGANLGSGTSAIAYSQAVNALSAGTTYYYCAIGMSAEGLAFGAVMSFTTLAQPTVVTNAATLVMSTTATLNGAANPNGASTNGWFRYSTTNPGTCNDTFGTFTSATALGNGTASVAHTRAIAGLTPATTYYFCAIASNVYGTGFGAVMSFTTPAVAPSVSTVSVTMLTGSMATLNGSANPNGDVATGWFRYSTVSPGTCNDSFGTRAPASGGSALGGGITAVAYSQGITGLTQGTTYFYCAIASNSLGTSVGNVLTFTTPAPPTVVTVGSSGIGNTFATLDGSANPNRATTTGWFRYSATNPGTCDDTFGSRAPASGGSNLGAGTNALAWGQAISGLSADTTYYFCAIAQNSEGISFGAIMSFTTLAPPAVVTNAATLVTATTATLNGAADPNGASTSGWFRYSTTNPGTCNDTFGTLTSSSALGAGTASVSYSRAIGSLTPATTYYFCAIASNTYGTGFGAVMTFTTPALAPTVLTNSVTMLTGTTATLSGNANPNGDAATGWFRYSTVSPGTCNDTFGTRAPASGGSALGSGTTSVAYTQGITGLTQGTTYFYCAIASNSLGTSVGSLSTFTTPAPPTMLTVSSSSISSTSATLNGSGNPNRAATTVYFRISSTDPGTCNDTFGTRVPAVGGTSLGASSNPVSYSIVAAGLSPATLYYYCAIGMNAEGFGFGNVLTFTTLATPTVTTNAATLVASTTATLNGAANPNGATTNGWFRYDTTNPGTCNDSFGTLTTSVALGAGTTSVAYSRALSGLLPGATYYYCAIANNSVGTGFGAVMTFTTSAGIPSVTTNVPSGVTTTTATLNGSANPNGAATTAWFRISATNPGACDDVFGTRVPNMAGTALGAGNSAVTFSQSAPGIMPGTTYYYCAIANNSAGTGFGIIRSFTTPATPTVNTLAATPVTATSATLNASANPNGFATTGWFRYSTVDPGACDDTFGTRAPGAGGTGLGAGTAFVNYSQALSTLSPATTYYFCAIASSSIGTTFGAVLSFTTPPTAPVVTTVAASSIGATSATINASASPNGQATTGWFRYATTNPGLCNDTFGTRAPASGGTALGTGNNPVAYNEPLTGLTAGTTYYYCGIASNMQGTGFGAIMSFTTANAPSVNSVAATAVTSSTATLNGSAIANQLATTGWFRYSSTNPGTCNDTFGTRAPGSGGTNLGSGTTSQPYSQAISGLASGTVYYFCAIASNSVGTSFGGVLSFTTTSTPTVTTNAATLVTSTTATLNGNGNPNGVTSTGYFRYSATNPGTCNDTFGTRAPGSGGTALGAGTAGVNYSQAISALASGTVYYYCAIATNSNGTGFGAVMTFTTAGAPTVTTDPPMVTSATTATLNGTASPNQAAATGWFRYSTTNPGACNDTFGTRAPGSGGTALGAGTTGVAYSEPITGLAAGTTYFYCAIASNSNGTRFGAIVSFTTNAAAPTVATNAATAVASTTATLNGSGDPNGDSATGWFRYDTTNPGTCDDTFGTRAPMMGGSALGAGTSPVAYSAGISGLAGGTTYYYCAIASNSLGTSFGAIQMFTTTAAPLVTTTTATLVASTSATLNGTANPNGLTSTGYFRFSTVDPGTCNDTFGTRAPTSGGTALGAGTAVVSYSRAISGLTTGTTYYYCAIANSSAGTGFGSVMSFTTTALPTVTTNAATSVGTTTATLEGSASPNGVATTGWFRYSATNPGTCNDTFGTRAPGSGGASLGAGTTSVPYSQPITGLANGATYYYCAIASNSVGTGFGAVMTFTTAATPIVTTVTASAITSTSATINGSANPNNLAATGWFRYSTTNPGTCNDTFGTRAPTSGGTALGSGNTAVAYSEPLTGLTSATTYYYCAIASSSAGTGFGSVMSFTTPAAPTVTTLAATGIAGMTATLVGSANPNFAATTGWFRYSATDPGICDDTFGTRAPTSGGSALGAGGTAAMYMQSIVALAPSTTYYYCAIAQNSVGTSFGSILSFTTSAAPTVTTVAASAVSSAGATLNGTANPNNAAATGWFRYSTTNPNTCDDTFGTRAPTTGGTALGAGATAVPFSQAITGLAPVTTYYFCAIASNSEGTRFGTILTFTTPTAAPTVATLAPTAVGGDMATLNGSANPNGDTTTGWFRYSSTNPGTCNDTFGTRFPATGGTVVGGGTSAVMYSNMIMGLVPMTTYYYCAIAQSSSGTGFGTVVSFVPGAIPPTVTTVAASDIDGTSAMVNGTANPNASATAGYFRYGLTNPTTCTDSFGTQTPTTALGAGTTAASFANALTGLDPKQQYFYCAAASNAGGGAFGTILTFTTAAIPPTVTTNTPAIEGNAVTLHGSANPKGAATTGWFRYGTTDPGTCSDTFGTRTPQATDTQLGGGRGDVLYEFALSELAGGTYFYCAIASNEAGPAFGALMTFTVAGDSGGCCSTSRSTNPFVTIGTIALVGFCILRRRRRLR